MTISTRGAGRLRPALAAAAFALLPALPFGPLAPLGASLAAEPGRIDLLVSYEQALQHDPRMRAADEALAAGREKAEQGRALLRPQVGLAASLARLDERTRSSLPAALAGLAPDERAGQTHQVALQLTQPLYNAKSRAEREQLVQQSGLAEVQHRQAAQDLVKRVGEAYLAVLLAEETLRVVLAGKAAV
jgi:outer membrane protein